MSPAAVDFRSPLTSSQHKQNPSSIRNPNPNLQTQHYVGLFPSSNHQTHQDQGSSDSDSRSANTFNPGTSRVGGFDCSASSPAESKMSFGKNASCKSKPRLVKVRKQSGPQHGRSVLLTVPKDSGFNPFRRVSESSSGAEDATTSSSTANGFTASNADLKFGRFDCNVGFVFGGDKCDTGVDSRSGKTKSSENAGQSGAGKSGKFQNLGFVFRSNNGCSASNSSLENESLVFGTNTSSSGLNLSLGRGETCKSMGQFGVLGKVNSVYYDFGGYKNYSVLNSDSTHRESNESVEQCAGEDGKDNIMAFGFGATKASKSIVEGGSGVTSHKFGGGQFGKMDNLDSLYGAAKGNPGSDLCLKEGQLDESEGTFTGNEFGRFDNVFFVTGSSKKKSNSKEREPGDGSGKFGVDNFNEFCNLVCASVSNPANSTSPSNSKTNEYDENVARCDDETVKVEQDLKSGFKLDKLDFVFGANYRVSTPASNSTKKEFGKHAGKSVPNLKGKIKSDKMADPDINHDGRFVFGINKSNLVSSAVSEEGGLCRSPENFNFADNGKMSVGLGTDFQKAKADDVFGFGSGRMGSSSFDNSHKAGVKMNKPNSENAYFSNGFVNKPSDRTDSLVKFNFEFGSTSSLDSTSGKSTVIELSDEMKALNMNDSKKCDGSSMASDYTNFLSSINNIFVFGNNKNILESLPGQAGIAFGDQLKDAKSENHGNVGRDNNADSTQINTNDEMASGSSQGGAENSTAGGMKNTNGVNILSEQIKSSYFSSENFRKENQPANLTEKILDEGIVPEKKLNNGAGLNSSSFPPLFSSTGFSFQPNNDVPESSPFGRGKENDKFSFTNGPFDLGASSTNFHTPAPNRPSFSTSNAFFGLNEKLELTANSGSVKNRRLRTKGKLRKHVTARQWIKNNQSSEEGSSQKDHESPGCCSPMDFSPYEDISRCAPATTNSSVPTEAKYADLAVPREGSIFNGSNRKPDVPYGNGFDIHCGSCCSEDGRVKEFASKPELESIESKTEHISVNCPAVLPPEFTDFCSNTKTGGECRTQHFPDSKSQSFGDKDFNFTSSSPMHDSLLAIRRQYRKKYKMKVGCASPSSGSRNAEFASSHQSQGELSTMEVCEKWRIRGNQAYKNGDLSSANDFYTKGIDSVPDRQISGPCAEAIVLCYSNRAAARMSLGRIRDAIGDCMMAAALGPTFLKARIRAANCHLTLGEVEDALKLFRNCLESTGDVCLDRRIAIEAADGLLKAQKVAECVKQSAVLLQERTSDSATHALEILAEALSISSHSEKLLEMKGEALCMLQRYEEVIQLCEQSCDFAEKNFYVLGSDCKSENVDDSECKNLIARQWRQHLMSKAYYSLGRLEMALDVLENQHCGSMTQGSSISLAATIREILQHKQSGNEAFQSGKHAEAAEHYSAAISTSVESRPFAAICFCNRAAAYQALGQVVDAIADCSLAMALDANYSKAVSRRATLHETIRDHQQAVNDIQRLVSILEKQSPEKLQQADTPTGPKDSSVKDLRRARRRLSSLEKKAKQEIPLDLYLILGIKASDDAAEIKKAYRKAALRHHPDKAGQFLARSESGDDKRLWKEIAGQVHDDADRLFKMIGEAYAVLSDSTKRSNYDHEEEMRGARESSCRSRPFDSQSSSFESSTSGRPSNFYRSPFDRSSNRRSWQESWKSYGNSRSRW